MTTSERAAAVASLRTHAKSQPITVRVQGIATQPKDDLILATALSAKAAYLVTGDRPMQALGRYEATALRSPGQFLDLSESGA